MPIESTGTVSKAITSSSFVCEDTRFGVVSDGFRAFGGVDFAERRPSYFLVKRGAGR